MTAATGRNVVVNPGFDEPLPEGADGPPGWILGFADAERDGWDLDPDVVSGDGGRSLRFEPRVQCVATQVLDAPVRELEGREVRLGLRVRQDDVTTAATAMIVAFNPELPPDDVLQTGVAGKAQLVAPRGRDGRFMTRTASFTATAPAASLQVMLISSGDGGSVWFDDVEVEIGDAP